MFPDTDFVSFLCVVKGELTGEPEALLADMGDVGEEALMEAAQNFGPPKPYLNAQALEAAINRWKRHESDVGSPEAQIAQAHTKIIYLSEHLQLHPKDYASRRGLIAIVNKRRRMLNFLFKENPSKALEMAKELGIRFKPPGSVQVHPLPSLFISSFPPSLRCCPSFVCTNTMYGVPSPHRCPFFASAVCLSTQTKEEKYSSYKFRK